MSQPDTLTQDVQHVPINRLRAHPANPREGDVGAIWESIQENGFFGALVVQESSGCILAGNHRWMAAKEAGMQEVPVIYVDVDDERAMRILLADNRTNDVATYDGETLADLLEHLESTDGGLAGTGYDGDALDELLSDLERPADDEWADAFDSVPEGEREPFQQKTFTLHDSQAELIERALKVAKGAHDFDGMPNENSNGNALAAICETYMMHHA